MSGEIAGKEHPGLDSSELRILDQPVPVHALPAGDEEAEPAGAGVFCRPGQDQTILHCLQVLIQTVKIMAPPFYKGRELLQLGTADGCLHVRGFQVISEMRVYIFVIVSQGQLPILSVKPVAAQIIPSRRTHTVPPPVSEGADDLVEQRIVRIHGASFAHGHMVRRVKAGGPDVAYGAGKLLFSVYDIPGSQGIAVVLHQPETVLFTEGPDFLQIKGIAQSMGQHHCFGPLRTCFLQHVRINIVLRDGHIHKHRHRTVLDHRRHRSGKSGSHRDHLVAPAYLPISQQRRCESHKSQQIGGRTGIDQRAISDLQIFCQLFLKFLCIPA